MTRRYGTWAGNERGHAEDPTRCVANVQRGRGFLFAQCSKTRGKGILGDLCAQHAKIEATRGRGPLWIPEEVA
jgi:hypothetical protein